METDKAAAVGAETIHHSFVAYHRRFRHLTRRGQSLFEARDWAGIHRLTAERLGLHGKAVHHTHKALQKAHGDQLEQRRLWYRMKEAYTQAILGRDDFELAQTFFNSLSRKVFPHIGVDPGVDYVSNDFPLPFEGWEMASARFYGVHEIHAGVLRRVIADAHLNVPFPELDIESEAAAWRIDAALRKRFGTAEVEALDVLRPVFFRNKGAYIVGRARLKGEVMPIVLAIVHRDGGLAIDAVLCEEPKVSVVFSFARWYFHADVASPRQVIGFLRSLLPKKRVAELYISLGHNKHGKTEFYRDLMAHLASTTGERFVFAPGERGMVMTVFTLPSYEFVFKVIKDHFPPVKRTSRGQVLRRYQEVLKHDRVGRLVDFQEFEHVKFPRALFTDELLAELLTETSLSVDLDGDDLIIRHMYVGRRVSPLDLYLRREPPERAERAVIDWGQTIKDLAAANIFAGDMLLKNFGVTRHGRVVFYDYDELCPLTDCNFRRFPPSRLYDEELSDEPWFTPSENDIFPEELRTFVGLPEPLLTTFETHHGDLFDTPFWQAVQKRNLRGEVIDFYPYSEADRLRIAEPAPEPEPVPG